VMYGPDYWRRVLDFEPMVTWEAITKEDLDCLHFCDTPESAFEYLKAHLEANHLTPTTPNDAQVPALAKTGGGEPGGGA
jgi:predicted Rossmann-fold nucleotide-binding protein